MTQGFRLLKDIGTEDFARKGEIDCCGIFAQPAGADEFHDPRGLVAGRFVRTLAVEDAKVAYPAGHAMAEIHLTIDAVLEGGLQSAHMSRVRKHFGYVRVV